MTKDCSPELPPGEDKRLLELERAVADIRAHLSHVKFGAPSRAGCAECARIDRQEAERRASAFIAAAIASGAVSPTEADEAITKHGPATAAEMIETRLRFKGFNFEES